MLASDRWSCPHPRCGKTVVIDGSNEDVACAIAACQTRHYQAHREADAVSERIGWPLPKGRRRAE